MKSCKRSLVVLCLSLWIPIAAGGGCRQHEEANRPVRSGEPELAVAVTVFREETLPSYNEVAGAIEAVEQATIAARVTGVIEEMPVTLGSTVSKGEVLLRIRPGELAARISRASVELEQAQRNLSREKRLLENNAATREAVRSLEEAYRLAEAAHAEATAFLAYTTVRAPFDGLVASKIANRGDLATAGAPLLVLTDNKRLQAVCAVPETFLQRIGIGDELPVKVPAAGVEMAGRVKEIAPVADVQSRTAVVKIALDVTAGLLPGQFARVFLPAAAASVYLLPEEAIIPFGQMEKVFVLRGGKAGLRLVRTGGRRNGRVEILSGLTPGEQVVVQGAARLVDGQPVRIMR